MTGIAAALEKEHPTDGAGWTVRVEPYQESLVGESRPTLLIMLSGVACVLLVACASIANLFLVRAAGRTREVAVRLAIGAGRSRLVRQWLTESTVLALAGGLAGFFISLWAVPALVANAPISLPRLGRIEVDGRILVFNIGISLVTGLLCGLAPAIGSQKGFHHCAHGPPAPVNFRKRAKRLAPAITPRRRRSDSPLSFSSERDSWGER